MKVTAIVPASGAGRRMVLARTRSGVKKGLRKPFLILGRKPVLIHALTQLERSSSVDDIVLLVNASDIKKAEKLVDKFALRKVKKIKKGGRTRSESVSKGLAAVDKKTDLVLIHDGVRPFVSKSIIEKTLKSASHWGAAVAATRAFSTIKFADKKRKVISTPDRDDLWIIATPQAFKLKLLLKAYKKIKSPSKKIFDDSSLVERLGVGVRIIQDSHENIKITTPLDLTIGEAVLKNRRRQS